jgi:catechol 2,3-dioxygenase-like lactoylglutathione lyase family enzyme
LADLGVERTDFVGIYTQDLERAKKFYGETLGLKRNERSSDEWPEFETGNLTILLTTPERTGVTFAPNVGAVALRVPDVAEAMEEAQGRGRPVRLRRGVRVARVSHGVLQGP